MLLARGSSSPYAPAFGLLGALIGGAVLASGLEGVGFKLRRTLLIPGIGWLAYAKDTEGNIFGMMQMDKTVK